MKEVMAIIRLNKLSKTKKALEEAGFPAYNCRKVMGAGKKSIDPALIQYAIEEEKVSAITAGEFIDSMSRLVPKRLFIIVVKDNDVKNVVETIIEANCEGNPGDGRIFVLPISESIRIRDGQEQPDSESY